MVNLPQNSNKAFKSKKMLMVFVCVIIAIFGIVLSIGKFISAPWDMKVTATDIVSEEFNDNYGVLVDDAGNRMSILDKDKNISQVKYSYTTDGKLYFYDNVCLGNDSFYVNEYCYHEDTNFLAEEKITKYNFDGSKVSDLVTYSYDLNNNYTNATRIKYFSLSDDKLYFTYYDALSNTYSINSVTLASNQTAQETDLMQAFPDPTQVASVYSVGYDSSVNKLIVLDCFGNHFSASPADQLFSKSAANVIDSYNSEGTSAFVNFAGLDNTQIIYSEGDNIAFNLLLSLRILYFWLSVLFLVCFIIVLLVISLKRVEVNVLARKCKVPLIICASVIISIAVIAFVNSSDEQKFLTYNDNELAQNVLLAKDITMEDCQNLVSLDAKSDGYSDLHKKVSQKLQYKSLLSARTNMASNLVVCKLEGSEFVGIASSSNPSLSGLDFFAYDANASIDEYGVFKGFIDNETGDYRYAATYIYDSEGNVTGSIVCYSNADTASSLFTMERMLMMTAIASALIAISFVLMEVVSWVKSFLLRRKKMLTKQVRNEVSITDPLFFLSAAAASADSVVGVLVYSEMLIGTPFDGNMLMISLPLTAKAIGKIVGVLIFPKVLNKLGTKNTLLMASFGSFVCFVLSALFVFNSQIVLLSLVLCVSSLLRQFIWMYLDNVPPHLKDSGMRKELINKCSASAICGFALISIIVGYTSDLFGGWSVYICAAIPIFIFFIMTLFLLPKISVLDSGGKNNKKKSKDKGAIKFIFRGDVMILLCSAFAIGILITGYQSFIFPLIANMNGMSNSDVSNISVFANAVAFYVIPLFTSVQKRFGSVKILFAVEIVIGLLFLLFAFNSSFVWACLVYFVVQMLNKLILPGSKDCWQNIAKKSHIDSNTALTGISLANNALNLLKNPVMGVLMAGGTIFACVAIGIYTAVSSVLFMFFGNKNSSSDCSEEA